MFMYDKDNHHQIRIYTNFITVNGIESACDKIRYFINNNAIYCTTNPSNSNCYLREINNKLSNTLLIP